MTVFRVFLNGRWISSHTTREDAERAIAGWMREWDGEFEIKEIKARATS